MTEDPTAGEPAVVLREVTPEDCEVFYEQHLDSESIQMAAVEPRGTRQAFLDHWANVLASNENLARTAVVDGEVAGHVTSWPQDGNRMVGYWFGREFWGRGIATRALAAYLDVDPARPLRALVAVHNVASKRVLEKCGFGVIGRAFAEDGIEEFTLVLKH
jgi:RimJ/RimL family protein N-acetyltransferase